MTRDVSRFYLALIAVLANSSCLAAQRVELRGRAVYSGEPVQGGDVRLFLQDKILVTPLDNFGQFRMSVPQSHRCLRLMVTRIGYGPAIVNARLVRDTVDLGDLQLAPALIPEASAYFSKFCKMEPDTVSWPWGVFLVVDSTVRDSRQEPYELSGGVDLAIADPWPTGGRRDFLLRVVARDAVPGPESCFAWDSSHVAADTFLLRIAGRRRCERLFLMGYEGRPTIAFSLGPTPFHLRLQLPMDTVLVQIQDRPFRGVFAIVATSLARSEAVGMPIPVGRVQPRTAHVVCSPGGYGPGLCEAFVREFIWLARLLGAPSPSVYAEHHVVPPFHLKQPSDPSALAREVVVVQRDTAQLGRMIDVAKRFTAAFPRTRRSAARVVITTADRQRFSCSEGECVTSVPRARPW